ncbi:MAG TPA: phage baseplate assembly protein V [Bryobacteraceae bacterium]|nr:phage baseplate assembly protein V [Bryobacteraceae bacterium]
MANAYVEVLIGGQTLSEFSQGVLMQQVNVVQEINRHWWCHVSCRQTEDQRFPIEGSLGKDLQVIAYDEDQNPTYLFSGFVLEAEMEYEIYGSFTAQLTGVSKTYNMDLAKRQKYYPVGKNTLAAVASDTTGRAGLSAAGDIPGYLFPNPLVQWGETDFNLLVRTADDCVRFIHPNPSDAGQIEVKNQFGDGPTLQWRTEDQLMGFKISGKLQAPTMDGAHYDFLEGLSEDYQQVAGAPVFLGGAPQMVSTMQSQSAAVLKPGYVVNRRGIRQLSQYKALCGRESMRGLETGAGAYGNSLVPAVQAGNKVIIAGLDDNANGTYGVTKVVHQWTSAGYTNQFWCTASAEYKDEVRPTNNPWYGVVIARVFDNNDPEKLGRIQVQYFWQEENQTFWARMMTPHAGSARGFLFVPEVGDEVVVAFEDGDPERPIIMGCLWNKPNTPPTEDFWSGGEEYSNDDIKRIFTKSGHRIQFVDKDGKESIVIATPKHIKVAMIENTDENGRATLLLQSDGDIILDAGGRIHCKSPFFSREVG